MAISRPFLLAVLGALLLGATALAVQNARTASNGDAVPAALQTKAAPAPAQPATAAGPEQTLKSAFDLGKLDSARFAAKFAFTGGSVRTGSFGVSGAFQTGDANEIPKFDVNLRVSAGGQSVGGGLVSLGDKAYFVRGDTGWRVPAVVWTPLVASIAGGGAGQQKLPFDLHPANWVRDVKSEGTDTIAGVKAEHVSARVDPKAVMNDLTQAVRQTGAELPNQAQVTRAIKRADLDVWVGSDDQILRRLSAQVVFAGRGRLDLDVRLSDVNKPQQIEAPAHVRAGAPDGTLGQVAEGLVGGINGITGERNVSLAALTSPNPRRAARAVRDHKQVVILFSNPRGLDDRAMASVIRDVDRRTKALVLTDDVDAVERYGKLVEDLGVSQTPSVVIIGRSGKAQLIEGYVDSDTLTQAVADAR
ncbi:MAG: hypothetical protein QOD71_3131 [Thermoleophilaceae bacterium]|jgi:hypothetical protein|nr:hypothetical protein [Thermoleophilaceae bacterium]